MPRQRYVSKELTHFVGRSPSGLKSVEDQYATLRKILTKPCWLTKHPDRPGTTSPIDIDGYKKMCENDMFQPDAVCFCDIPPEDYAIHMGKYGSFGLSFLKEFLVPKGASPVFYVARDSRVGFDFRDGKPVGEASRGSFFDKHVFDYLALNVQRRQWIEEGRTWEGVSELLEHINLLSHPTWFLYYHVFSFIKCFDSTLEEDHLQNYYMEREWRVSGDLSFELVDVWRVILPREYAKRFRGDFPDFNGQITFAE